MENDQPSSSGGVNGNASAPTESYVPSLPSTGAEGGASSNSKHSRVTSTVAQSFAADLDSMFGLSSGGTGVDALSQNVEDKYVYPAEYVQRGMIEKTDIDSALSTERRTSPPASPNSSNSKPNSARPNNGWPKSPARTALPGKQPQEQQLALPQHFGATGSKGNPIRCRKSPPILQTGRRQGRGKTHNR